MNPRFVLRLRAPRRVFDTSDGGSVKLSDGVLQLAELPTGVRRAIRRLVKGATEAELEQLADDGGIASLTFWYYCVERMLRDGTVACEVVAGRATVARAISLVDTDAASTAPSGRWVLSQFAFLRPADATFIVESAMSSARVELIDPRAIGLVTALVQPMTTRGALGKRGTLSEVAARDVIDLLRAAGMLTHVNSRGQRAENSIPSLGEWDFADLLFHNRSRAFRSNVPAAGNRAGPPAVKAPMSKQQIALPVPEPRDRDDADGFIDVLERRQSVREHGERAVTLSEIGAFLYRSARVRRLAHLDGDSQEELSQRPYPGAGARYELETYLAVRDCEGIAPGFYHYDPLHHRLDILDAEADEIERLFDDAALTVGSAGNHQVLVILSARFGRIASKYGAGSYALVLKDVGVLLQTMSLVATSLNLACCILGSGDAELFSRAAGTHSLAETSVGELLLGSLPR